MYPMVNTLFSNGEFQPIEYKLSQLCCSALGLNRNFPRCLLYGPLCLGGMGLISPKHKNTTNRINYFLFNSRQNTNVRGKFKISNIYTQLETGSFDHFFSIPYDTFGHLASLSTCRQLWRETEPFGVTLRPMDGITWTPRPLSSNDLTIMTLATSVYSKRGSAIINRCHLYLRVISVCDLLIHGKPIVHPDYFNGERPPSQTSIKYWPDFPCPPKKILGILEPIPNKPYHPYYCEH